MKKPFLLALLVATAICISRIDWPLVLQREATTPEATPIPQLPQLPSPTPEPPAAPANPTSSQPQEHLAELLPPRPLRHFNDYAGVAGWAAAARIENHLAEFERQTSGQVVVVIYPKFDAHSSLDAFTRSAFDSWNLGHIDSMNGLALFVFVADKRIKIEVGTGLRGRLPDSRAQGIIEAMHPFVQRGDLEHGLTNAVEAILASITVAKPPGRTLERSTPGPHDRVARRPVFRYY